MRRWIIGSVVALLFGGAASTAFADICVSPSAGLAYRLQIGVAGDAVIVNGVRHHTTVGSNLPIVGSGFVESSGDVILAINEMFDWDSGAWNHPHGTTVLFFPAVGGPAYDRTYHGNGTSAAVSDSGALSIVSCSGFPLAVGDGPDPNAK